jgi:hypothetical protein
MTKESIVKTISLAGLSGLMLILSYFFSLSQNSGGAPAILLFSGIILAILLAISAFTNK